MTKPDGRMLITLLETRREIHARTGLDIKDNETITRYIREGKLDGHRIGGRWLVTKASVARMLGLADLNDRSPTFTLTASERREAISDVVHRWSNVVLDAGTRGAHNRERFARDVATSLGVDLDAEDDER